MSMISTLRSEESKKIVTSFSKELFLYVENLFNSSSDSYKKFKDLPLGEKFEEQFSNGMRAIFQCYMTTSPDKAIIESHKKYTDLQIIFEGSELMQTAFIGDLEIKNEYVEEKDLTIYEEPSYIHSFLMSEKSFAIFRPEDAHRTTLQNKIPSLVRKVVIKIPCDLVKNDFSDKNNKHDNNVKSR